MKRLELVPVGWPCTLAECPPGPFAYMSKHVGFKSEYTSDGGSIEAFNEAGEYFWGDGANKVEDYIVQPLSAEWIEEES